MAAKMAKKQAHGTRVGAGNKKMYHEGARKPPVPPLLLSQKKTKALITLVA